MTAVHVAWQMQQYMAAKIPPLSFSMTVQAVTVYDILHQLRTQPGVSLDKQALVALCCIHWCHGQQVPVQRLVLTPASLPLTSFDVLFYLTTSHLACRQSYLLTTDIT